MERHCPEHIVRAHTQQHTWQAALSISCAKAEEGCIKHARWASQGVDLTLLNLSQDPTPPLTSLHSACDAAIIKWLACLLALPKKSAGKVPCCTPSAEAIGNFQQSKEFSGAKEGGFLGEFFGAGMWAVHTPHPSGIKAWMAAASIRGPCRTNCKAPTWTGQGATAWRPLCPAVPIWHRFSPAGHLANPAVQWCSSWAGNSWARAKWGRLMAHDLEQEQPWKIPPLPRVASKKRSVKVCSWCVCWRPMGKRRSTYV